jgi:2-keto-4-pentenoate hydratase/2-oxohepta-3-ene-1,7-dioic acid hydratase in catechol pathway
VVFTKSVTTLNGPYADFAYDERISKQIDWEVELGVVIGRGGRKIAVHEALDHVFGYAVINDLSARDLQSRHRQFFIGKSLDGSCPMGPWIVTHDEIRDPQSLELCSRVNGVVKQSSNTRQQIFDIATTISILSQTMTLEPGDIIATGTPSGVGFARTPPEFLQAGDVVECEVEKIGTIRNRIVAV